MSDRSLATPVAIVIAGALVGAGLFLGLRAAHPPAPAQSTAPAAGEPSPAVEVSSAKVVADAIAALETQRARILAECWQPSVKEQPEPATMSLVYSFTFDPKGDQRARGIVVDRATGRPDVTTCLTRTVAPLKIPPPGAVVSVDVPFRLP